MKIKKILSICLTVLLLVTSASVMSGCGDKAKVVDLDKRVIKLVSWGTNIGGVYVNPDDNSEFGQIKLERLKEYEEKYNCTFEFELMEAGDILSKFTTAALAGNSIGDLVCMRNPWVYTAQKSDLLLPLDEYFDFSKSQFSNFAKETCTVDGKVYGFSTETTNHVENGIYFNKRIFDDLGLEYPYEMVKNKTWTTDVFAEYLKKATVVKNGVTEIYGMYGFTHNGDGLASFLSCFGAEFAHKTENGYVSGLNDPEMTTALEFIRKNTLDGYIYNVSGEADWTEAKSMFKDGKVAMYMGGTSTAQSGLKDEMTDDFGFVPLPLGPGQTEYSVMEMYENVWVMPASLEPEVAQAIADMLTGIFEPTTDNEADAKKELKKSIQSYYCDEDSVDIAVDLMTQDSMKLYNHYTIGASDYKSIVGGQVNQAIHTSKTTVASALGSVSQAWDMLLEIYNENNFGTDE